MHENARFVFKGRLRTESFVEFARHRAARLGLGFEVGQVSVDVVALNVSGAVELVDAFEMDLGTTIAAHQHSLFDTPGDESSLRAASSQAIRIMDDHMTARGFAHADWFAAGHTTIADIALFPAFALSRDFGIDHDEYPALRRWARRFRALPGFKTMPGIPDYH